MQGDTPDLLHGGRDRHTGTVEGHALTLPNGTIYKSLSPNIGHTLFAIQKRGKTWEVIMIRRKPIYALVTAVALAGLGLASALLVPTDTTAGSDDGVSIRGAGTTMVQGGTGSPTFTPVLTDVAFHWRKGSGAFECLALAPSIAAGGPGSGNFDTNVMYVTGKVTSARVHGSQAVLKGIATVTGVGAGSDMPFTATLTRGGPGATLVLEISGLTFREILLEGEFRF